MTAKSWLGLVLGSLLLVGAGCFGKANVAANVNVGADAGAGTTAGAETKTAAEMQTEAAAKAESEAKARAEAEAKASLGLRKVWKAVLSPQAALAISGNVTLTEMENGKTNVQLTVTGAGAGMVMPAHIHLGACPKPGEVKWALSNVVGGKSETTLEVSMDDIKASLPLAINVHKSESELQTYMSCGDLKESGMTEVKIDAGLNTNAGVK